MNNNLMKMLWSKQGVTGLLVFLLPCLSLVTLWGVSACSFIFFIVSLVLWRDCRAALARHWPQIRWVVLAFLCHFLFVSLCYLLRPEAILGNLEKPARMFFAVSALALVLAFRPARSTLWWGVIAGAIGGAALVFYQGLGLEMERPGGMINPITYGDLLLCLALVSLAAAVDLRHTRRVLGPGLAALAALAGLAGVILNGTRGGWIALIMAALVLLRYSHVVKGRLVPALVALTFTLFGAAYFVPDTGVRVRVQQGISDATTYFDGGSAFSNVGIRLELWKAAALLIAERPVLGADKVVVKSDIERYVREGRVDDVVVPMPHFHNDGVQALVTGGVVGFAAWLATLVAPLLFFAQVLRARGGDGKLQFAPALGGMLVVVSFFSFGLTEVIFWSVKGSLFYALMIFVLMGLCLNAKENVKAHDGK